MLVYIPVSRTESEPRPRLLVWIGGLAHAALWLIVSLVILSQPPQRPCDCAAPNGRELIQVGPELCPAAGVPARRSRFAPPAITFSVYLLADLGSIASFWFLYHLAQHRRSAQQAVLCGAVDYDGPASSSRLAFGPQWWRGGVWACCCLHSPARDRALTGATPGFLPGRDRCRMLCF